MTTVMTTDSSALREFDLEQAAGESVLSKADRVLSALQVIGGKVRLTELSRMLDLPKATVYRLAMELTSLGYLRKSAGGYELGWRMYEMGQTVPELARLREAALPGMADLWAATRAIEVKLSVARGSEVICVERLAGRREIPLLKRLGLSSAGMNTAAGRLFAAYGYRGSVPHSDAIRTNLNQIRQQRWAAERGERIAGLKTFAVPITLDGPAKVVAAISVTITMDRTDERSLVNSMWATSAEISCDLQLSTLESAA